MEKDKDHINNFIKCIFEDKYADAKGELQSAILEKIKGKMETEILEGRDYNNNKDNLDNEGELYVITVGKTGNNQGHAHKDYFTSDNNAVRRAKQIASKYHGNGWWKVERDGKTIAKGGGNT